MSVNTNQAESEANLNENNATIHRLPEMKTNDFAGDPETKVKN